MYSSVFNETSVAFLIRAQLCSSFLYLSRASAACLLLHSQRNNVQKQQQQKDHLTPRR